MHLKIISHY